MDKIISPEKELSVFGNDYDTRDGSGIRDYIHVSDIASAHISALMHINTHSNSIYNIGTSSGYSVLEVIKEAESTFNTVIDYNISDRRPGDPADLTSTFGKINNELGWKPEYSLREMLVSTMDWRKNPKY